MTDDDANAILQRDGAEVLRGAFDRAVTKPPAEPAQPNRGNGGEHGPRPFAPIEGEDKEAPPPRVVCPAIFKGRTPPPMRWIAPQWIPYGVSTGFYGDGGVGKTLLAQQLQTGTARGSSWLGLPVAQVASLGVYCEDDESGLWRRQPDINAAYGVEDEDALALVHWMPRLGEDNILMTFTSKGVGELTRFHGYVLEAALDLKVRLAIIDTAADTFGGNENIRGEVRQFVQRALGQIALKIDGAVVCCAHPSRAGLSSGEGDSGSTGWSNAFRSRAYVDRPKAENGEAADVNARIVTRKKANFASIGDTIKAQWRNGVIVPDMPSMPSCFRRSADEVFLALLDAVTSEGQKVSPKPRAGNFAPAFFMKREPKEREDYRRGDFERAMQVLLQRQRIKIVPYDSPSRGLEKIVRADETGVS